MPVEPYKPTVRRIKGLHDTAKREGSVAVIDYEPTVDSIPLRQFMRKARRVLWENRRTRVQYAANLINYMRHGELRLKISQIPEMEARKFSPTRIEKMLGSLEGISDQEMNRMVAKISGDLYKSSKSMMEISKERRAGLEGKVESPPSLLPLVWLVNSIVAARLSEHGMPQTRASPQLQGVVFKRFDRDTLRVSPELQKQHGLSFRTAKTLRDRYAAWNRAALPRSGLGRSPESFARIMWKLKNYGFHGAEQRILLEEALEGEPVSYQALAKYKAELEANIEIARKIRKWEALERRGEIPNPRERREFSEGFARMLGYEGISLSKQPVEAEKLRKQVRAILAELDWSTRSFPQIAGLLGFTERYVRLVNAAFNARPPQGVPNIMREYIERREAEGTGSKRIAPMLRRICTKKTGRGTAVNEGTIQKVLTRIKAESKKSARQT